MYFSCLTFRVISHLTMDQMYGDILHSEYMLTALWYKCYPHSSVYTPSLQMMSDVTPDLVDAQQSSRMCLISTSLWCFAIYLYRVCNEPNLPSFLTHFSKNLDELEISFWYYSLHRLEQCVSFLSCSSGFSSEGAAPQGRGSKGNKSWRIFVIYVP